MSLFAGTSWYQPPRCERCGDLETVCRCPPAPAPPRIWLAAEKQTARLTIEKRKRGKSVTVVSGLSPNDCDLADLLTRLKIACGAGGTIKDNQLEIQGEHLQRIRTLVVELGYRING